MLIIGEKISIIAKNQQMSICGNQQAGYDLKLLILNIFYAFEDGWQRIKLSILVQQMDCKNYTYFLTTAFLGRLA